MRFQFYSCSTIDHWQLLGDTHEHSEVHFALFGRDVDNNESVAITFRYCPYLVVKEPTNRIKYTHYDTVLRTPLHGYSENKVPVHRLFIPSKRQWERHIKDFKTKDNATELLDYHHTLELQMRMVLGIKPLDVIVVNVEIPTQFHHTTLSREYNIPIRLTVQNREQFPVRVEPTCTLVTQPTILSFDVEAYSDTGAFPTPRNSHTIAICYSHRNFEGEIIKEDKLTLKDRFETEADLLMAFQQSVLDCDPDFITGWNTHGFDWPYLLERASLVGATSFSYLDRLKCEKVEMWGYTNKSPTFGGRVVFDAMHLVKSYKERISTNSNKPESYKLDYIAKMCLGRGKVELSIPDMRRSYQLGEMNKIGDYCLVDARLPLEIMQRENIAMLLFQLASLSGASLKQSFQMTNSSLVIASLSYAVHEHGYVYDLPKPRKGKYQGAFVFEPKPGFCACLGVLDFAALYPSIIISYNYCYTTHLGGGIFSTKHRGLLPLVLGEFQAERAKVKVQMKHCETDCNLLDSRQQGIKTICNSFYGVLGSDLLFGLQIIAETITLVGRNSVQSVQRYLEAKGYLVKLMDTDSCCIEVPGTVEESARLCENLAREISTELFTNKLTLEYEKQLRPAVIFKKKMYAGFDPVHNEMIVKGLSAKRRNIMPYTRETFSRVLELLCREGDIAGAYEYVVNRFQQLSDMSEKPWSAWTVPVEKFAVTSAIKHASEYKATPSLGFRVNQKLEHPLGPGERISFVYYYEKSNLKHNGSKQRGHWRPGTNVDTAIPLESMKANSNLVVDVDRVLMQHHHELEQYFGAVSRKHANLFTVLFKKTSQSIRQKRGCTIFKNYSIMFLNLC